MRPTYVVGDIHGWAKPLAELLRREGLIDGGLNWMGGEAHLVFLGDYMDRGPDGIGVVDLIMRLEAQAPAHGGRVDALLGNHDLMVQGVVLFGERRIPDRPPEYVQTFVEEWVINGGQVSDIMRMQRQHLEWLQERPAVLRLGDDLLVHSDSAAYLAYGPTPEAVNFAVARVLKDGDIAEWNRLDGNLMRREAFRGRGGPGRARKFLNALGARRLIHGHTPICRVRKVAPDSVTGPLVYAGGLCVNLDHALYMGGKGFVFRADQSA